MERDDLVVGVLRQIDAPVAENEFVMERLIEAAKLRYCRPSARSDFRRYRWRLCSRSISSRSRSAYRTRPMGGRAATLLAGLAGDAISAANSGLLRGRQGRPRLALGLAAARLLQTDGDASCSASALAARTRRLEVGSILLHPQSDARRAGSREKMVPRCGLDAPAFAFLGRSGFGGRHVPIRLSAVVPARPPDTGDGCRDLAGMGAAALRDRRRQIFAKPINSASAPQRSSRVRGAARSA